MSPRKKRYNEPSKTIGIRVPKSEMEVFRKELNDYADYFYQTKVSFKTLINKNNEH